MPIYEYECGSCGDRHEFIQKFSEGPKKKCPSCGERKLRRLVSAAAFHLKGSGWYVTDFRDKDKKKANGEGKKADEKSDGGSKESKKGEGSSSKSKGGESASA